MILQASQRAGAAQLSAHLLNDHDNDHVTVLEVRGFVSDDLHEAFAEAKAIAEGTKCQQYLFSLSLNPPKGASVGEQDFEKAADEAERRLGLSGQPRAIVMHEKEGRRHAHVVWSRIDAERMKAINLPHFKYKLTTLSKELFLEHGWELPEGLRRIGGKNPLNFTLDEYQQAKRIGLDPREIKDAFHHAFKHSDTLAAFGHALEERGYFLAKGDERVLVAVDVNGEVYAVSKYAGVRVKDLRERFGDAAKGEGLPSVNDRRVQVRDQVTDQLRGFLQEMRDDQASDLKPLRARNDELRREHREQRLMLKEKQAKRERSESEARAQKYRTGLGGLLDTLSGRATAIKRQNAMEAYEKARRDQKQRDQLVFDQMDERRALQGRIDKMRLRHVQERKELHKDLMAHVRQQDRRDGQEPSLSGRTKKRGFSLDL